MEKLFCDGMEKIELVRGMIKINYATFEQVEGTKKEDKKFEIDDQYQVVMTPQAFLESFANMDRFVTQMKEKGLITVTPNKQEKENKKK